MKTNFENLLDLQEAFEAVKGQLFGPLDPALVKLKHKEIVQDAKERREQESDPRGRLGLARDDHAERDRRDRDHNMRTLTWLLANDRAYREAHERAIGAFINAGNAIDRAIETAETAREKLRRQMEDYLITTARLSDGRYVMITPDGTYRDQSGEPITADDAVEVEGRIIQPFASYEAMMRRKADIERDLDELRGWSVEVGDMRNKINDDEEPASQDELDGMAERADDLAERAQEMQRGFERDSPDSTVDRERMAEESLGRTATMAIPKLP